jgi:MFS family permease
MRGRVMAIYMAVFMGGTPLGSPLIGWVGQTLGARWSLIVGGGLTVLGTLGATLLFNRRRGLVVRPRLWPRPRLDVLPAGGAVAVDVLPAATSPRREMTAGAAGPQLRKVS